VAFIKAVYHCCWYNISRVKSTLFIEQLFNLIKPDPLLPPMLAPALFEINREINNGLHRVRRSLAWKNYASEEKFVIDLPFAYFVFRAPCLIELKSGTQKNKGAKSRIQDYACLLLFIKKIISSYKSVSMMNEKTTKDASPNFSGVTTAVSLSFVYQ